MVTLTALLPLMGIGAAPPQRTSKPVVGPDRKMKPGGSNVAPTQLAYWLGGFDVNMTQIINMRESLLDSSVPVYDSSVRAFQTAVREFFFSPDTQLKLEGQRDEVDRLIAAGDLDAAADLFAKMNTLVLEQQGLMQEITRYVNALSLLRQREASFAAFLRANVVSNPRLREFNDLAATLDQAVAVGRFKDAREVHIAGWLKLIDVAEREAMRTAIAVGTLIGGKKTRSAPCPRYLGHDSVSGPPKLDPAASGSTDNYYAPESRRNGAQGSTAVHVSVSKEGCVMSAQVAVSSGFFDLDESALKWSLEAASFRPAVRNGKAVDGENTFVVRFRLDD